MILLSVYCPSSCFADYLLGCDVVTIAITFGEALWLETLL